MGTQYLTSRAVNQRAIQSTISVIELCLKNLKKIEEMAQS